MWVRDQLEALPDLLAIRAGMNPTRPHPVAEQMHEANVKLRTIAEDSALVSGLETNKPVGADRRVALGKGLQSTDFG